MAVRREHILNEACTVLSRGTLGTSEYGNPSKFNILNQDQTDADIWPECVSLTRTSRDENCGGIFTSISNTLLQPL